MTEVQRIVDQLNRAGDDEAWHGRRSSDGQAWERAREGLRQNHDELRSAISLLDESRLDQPIIEGMSSFYVTLHGIIQHGLYHAGQIAILKKASSED